MADGAQQGTATSERKVTVLCVGADTTLNYTRRLVLEMHGYNVAVATNLAEARNALQHQVIGCVLIESDLNSIAHRLQSIAPDVAVVVAGRRTSDRHGQFSIADLDGPRKLVDAVNEALTRGY